MFLIMPIQKLHKPLYVTFYIDVRLFDFILPSGMPERLETAVIYKFWSFLSHTRKQEVLAEGSNFENVVYSLMRGGKIQMPLLAGHHRLASETPFEWCFAGVPMMAQHWMLACQLCDFKGIRTSIAKKPYILLFSRCVCGGGGGPDPLSPHAFCSYDCRLRSM